MPSDLWAGPDRKKPFWSINDPLPSKYRNKRRLNAARSLRSDAHCTGVAQTQIISRRCTPSLPEDRRENKRGSEQREEGRPTRRTPAHATPLEDPSPLLLRLTIHHSRLGRKANRARQVVH